MSLLAAIGEWEARHSKGETRPETPIKQPKQVFHEPPSCFTSMKHQNSQKTADFDHCFTVSSLRVRNSETPLPQAVQGGIEKLRSSWQPRGVRAADWLVVADDARCLAADGWAESALALGWSVEDLFGIGASGSDEWLSLAVWLDGRTVALLDDHRAVATDGAVYCRERWGRPNSRFAKPVMLWEWNG